MICWRRGRAGSKTQMGGTMRLGTRRTLLKTDNCHAARLYSSLTVDERRVPPHPPHVRPGAALTPCDRARSSLPSASVA